MEVHKPHPIHSWRELLKEVGIIVLGVLIALAGEQSVEALHWHHRVADAEAAMRAELKDDDGPQAYARLMIAGCIDQELAGLATALEQERDAGGAVPSGQLEWPPLITWDADAWQNAVSSGTSIHMSADRLAKWAAPYDFIAALGRQNIKESEDVAELRTLRHARAPLASAERDRLFLTIERLRRDNAMIADLSYYFLENVHNAGLNPGLTPDGARLRARFVRMGACFNPAPVVPDKNRRPMTID